MALETSQAFSVLQVRGGPGRARGRRLGWMVNGPPGKSLGAFCSWHPVCGCSGEEQGRGRTVAKARFTAFRDGVRRAEVGRAWDPCKVLQFRNAFVQSADPSVTVSKVLSVSADQIFSKTSPYNPGLYDFALVVQGTAHPGGAQWPNSTALYRYPKQVLTWCSCVVNACTKTINVRAPRQLRKPISLRY